MCKTCIVSPHHILLDLRTHIEKATSIHQDQSPAKEVLVPTLDLDPRGATSLPREALVPTLDLDPREATSLPSREVVLKTVTWKVRHGTAMVTLQSVEVDPTSQAREPTLLDLEARDLTSHPRVSLPSMVPRESHPRAHLPLMVPRGSKGKGSKSSPADGSKGSKGKGSKGPPANGSKGSKGKGSKGPPANGSKGSKGKSSKGSPPPLAPVPCKLKRGNIFHVLTASFRVILY